MNDGFFADVLEAAEHLYQIDTVPARGTFVYGFALMKNERLEDAERIFLTHTEKYGEDGAVLTNLARIYSARNETDRAEATLWHALEVDPNQENALIWYAALGHERAGKKGMVEAWQRIASLPRSWRWRAQLWLARTALESHDPQQALALYRESLSLVGDSIPADVLMQISGDLGKHGLMAEAIQLSEPVFAPEVHGLQVGNNLIKANLAIGRVDSARRILNQLRIAATARLEGIFELLGNRDHTRLRRMNVISKPVSPDIIRPVVRLREGRAAARCSLPLYPDICIL